MVKNLGDKIAAVATPIARMVGADCIDPETNELKEESPCAKAKRQLNMGVPLWDVFYDRFCSKTKEERMQLFNIQMVVEAEDVKEALSKLSEAKVLSINPRPVAPPLPQRSPTQQSAHKPS